MGRYTNLSSFSFFTKSALMMMMMMMMTLLLGDDEPPLNLAAEGPHGDYRCRDERRGVDSPCVEIYGHDYCFDDKADFSNILQPSIVTGNDVELVVCYYVSDLALAYYTVFQKKGATLLMAVTSSNLNRFSNFFHHWKEKEISNKTIYYFPPHLKYVAALP